MKTILILATLDTKYEEAEILKECIRANGCHAVLLDCSLRYHHHNQDNQLRREMMAKAPISEEQLCGLDKNNALARMTELVGEMLQELYAAGKFDGVIGIGGVQGTLISTGAMQKLAVGVPKLVLSAVANGKATFGPLVGMSDMTIMHSVVDIAGKNSIIEQLMANAAAAVCGMANQAAIGKSSDKMVGITMGGVTTECGNHLQNLLEQQGYQAVVFHCNGIGAMAMEQLADAGRFSAIIDLTPHDVTDYLYDGMMPAAADRYEVFQRRNIPLIIVPGCADIILFNGMENVPEKYRNRKMVAHNSIHTHVKANYDEMFGLGRYLAEKANLFCGQTAILIPEKGFSQKNRQGDILYEPESDEGFIKAVEKYKSSQLMVKTVPFHINEPAFAKLCVDELLSMTVRE